MQPQYSHLLPWATPASQRVAAHIALLLRKRAASWAKVQQTVSEKGQKISGFVGSNCTLKRTNYPIVSCSVNSTKTWELLHCWHVGRSWMTANDPSSPEARVIDPHQWERQQGGMWKLGRNVVLQMGRRHLKDFHTLVLSFSRICFFSMWALLQLYVWCGLQHLYIVFQALGEDWAQRSLCVWCFKLFPSSTTSWLKRSTLKHWQLWPKSLGALRNGTAIHCPKVETATALWNFQVKHAIHAKVRCQWAFFRAHSHQSPLSSPLFLVIANTYRKPKKPPNPHVESHMTYGNESLRPFFHRWHLLATFLWLRS